VCHNKPHPCCSKKIWVKGSYSGRKCHLSRWDCRLKQSQLLVFLALKRLCQCGSRYEGLQSRAKTDISASIFAIGSSLARNSKVSQKLRFRPLFSCRNWVRNKFMSRNTKRPQNFNPAFICGLLHFIWRYIMRRRVAEVRLRKTHPSISNPKMTANHEKKRSFQTPNRPKQTTRASGKSAKKRPSKCQDSSSVRSW
jgi:hypothetical protein